MRMQPDRNLWLIATVYRTREVIYTADITHKELQAAQQMMAPIVIDKAYMTAETITVKDLTERIGKPAGEIIKKLLLLEKMPQTTFCRANMQTPRW